MNIETIKSVYFVGAGGIGMSALVRYFLFKGKVVADVYKRQEQEELALTGQHNLYNSLAAGISANLAGIAKENIRNALSDFKGVEHRLEKVARVRGIDFINDTKATNVNSCWYALQSMTTKTVLILGGKDKGNDYTEIEDLVSYTHLEVPNYELQKRNKKIWKKK